MTQNSDRARKVDEEKTARLAGTGAGVIAGAQVGTFLLPIPVVGTFTGALVGGVIGSKIGRKVGGVLMDQWNSTCGERPAPAANQPDLSKELERLVRLRDEGILNDEEFKAAKSQLLGL